MLNDEEQANKRKLKDYIQDMKTSTVPFNLQITYQYSFQNITYYAGSHLSTNGIQASGGLKILK